MLAQEFLDVLEFVANLVHLLALGPGFDRPAPGIPGSFELAHPVIQVAEMIVHDGIVLHELDRPEQVLLGLLQVIQLEIGPAE